MKYSHLWLSAAFTALVVCPAWAGDTMTAGGVGSLSSAAVPTQNLRGSADDPADTIEVFHGRFRPYWRGYYHGSSGYSARPNLYNGPFITSRYYGYRPGIGGYAYARPTYYAAPPAYYAAAPIYYSAPLAQYCVTTVAPVAVAGETAAPPLAVPPSPPAPVTNGFRFDGGPAAPIATPNLAPPAPAPTLEVEPPFNRVKATARKPAYVGYGESDVPRAPTMLVKKPK